MSTTTSTYLPPGLPAPVPEADGLSRPFWDGLREQRLRVQRCSQCQTWQFGPEWICHHCHAFDPAWVDVAPQGVPPQGLVHSWERVWHPSHASLKQCGPYVVVLVELPAAGGVRLPGNLLGDAMQDVRIGMPVQGIFEHHSHPFPYTLLQWQTTTPP